MSRRPASDIWSVRGIGVALRESTSTRSLSWRRSSFCFTPKRCSSSTIRRPRSSGRTSRDRPRPPDRRRKSEEHTSELQSLAYLVCRLLLEKKKKIHDVVVIHDIVHGVGCLA